MDHEGFRLVLDAQIDKIRATLDSKSAEYSVGEDRLHNFKRAAALLGTTQEKALLGMLAKHLVSILDMVETEKDYTPERWDEKITDAINYLILLRAMAWEKDWAVDIENAKVGD